MRSATILIHDTNSASVQGPQTATPAGFSPGALVEGVELLWVRGDAEGSLREIPLQPVRPPRNLSKPEHTLNSSRTILSPYCGNFARQLANACHKTGATCALGLMPDIPSIGAYAHFAKV